MAPRRGSSWGAEEKDTRQYFIVTRQHQTQVAKSNSAEPSRRAMFGSGASELQLGVRTFHSLSIPLLLSLWQRSHVHYALQVSQREQAESTSRHRHCYYSMPQMLCIYQPLRSVHR